MQNNNICRVMFTIFAVASIAVFLRSVDSTNRPVERILIPKIDVAQNSKHLLQVKSKQIVPIDQEPTDSQIITRAKNHRVSNVSVFFCSDRAEQSFWSICDSEMTDKNGEIRNSTYFIDSLYFVAIKKGFDATFTQKQVPTTNIELTKMPEIRLNSEDIDLIKTQGLDFNILWYKRFSKDYATWRGLSREQVKEYTGFASVDPRKRDIDSPRLVEDLKSSILLGKSISVPTGCNIHISVFREHSVLLKRKFVIDHSQTINLEIKKVNSVSGRLNLNEAQIKQTKAYLRSKEIPPKVLRMINLRNSSEFQLYDVKPGDYLLSIRPNNPHDMVVSADYPIHVSSQGDTVLGEINLLDRDHVSKTINLRVPDQVYGLIHFCFGPPAKSRESPLSAKAIFTSELSRFSVIMNSEYDLSIDYKTSEPNSEGLIQKGSKSVGTANSILVDLNAKQFRVLQPRDITEQSGTLVILSETGSIVMNQSLSVSSAKVQSITSLAFGQYTAVTFSEKIGLSKILSLNSVNVSSSGVTVSALQLTQPERFHYNDQEAKFRVYVHDVDALDFIRSLGTIEHGIQLYLPRELKSWLISAKTSTAWSHPKFQPTISITTTSQFEENK